MPFFRSFCKLRQIRYLKFLITSLNVKFCRIQPIWLSSTSHLVEFHQIRTFLGQLLADVPIFWSWDDNLPKKTCFRSKRTHWTLSGSKSTKLDQLWDRFDCQCFLNSNLESEFNLSKLLVEFQIILRQNSKFVRA